MLPHKTLPIYNKDLKTTLLIYKQFIEEKNITRIKMNDFYK